jgi:hypothetical protein
MRELTSLYMPKARVENWAEPRAFWVKENDSKVHRKYTAMKTPSGG